MFKRAIRLAAVAMAIAAAGCSGSDGAQGPQGPQGDQGTPGQDGTDYTAVLKPEACAGCHRDSGTYHQAEYNKYTDATTFSMTIDSVQTVGTTSAMRFTIQNNGAPYVDPGLAFIDQKTFYAVLYDPATRRFTPSFSYSSPAMFADGQYVVTTASSGAGASFAPEAAGSVAMVYAYIAKGALPTGSAYTIYDDVVNVARVYGGALDYVSAANVSGCEKCHGAPYQKHGYRAARVPGVPDFAACKTCHYDTRKGSHPDWQLLVDDPLAYATQNAVLTADQKTRYAYTANVMNDVHMAHAMEFAYPQSMANCTTCHEGKLPTVLADSQFKLSTCKSCHAVKGPSNAAYVDAKRAPALEPMMANTTTDAAASHVSILADGLYTTTRACNTCHRVGGGAPAFATLHTGFEAKVYTAANDGTKYSDAFTVTIDAASITTQMVKVSFSATEVGADPAVVGSITPTIVVGLYGYDTKDFIVDAHGRDAGAGLDPASTTGGFLRSLEWVYGKAHNRFKALKALPRTDGQWQFTVDLGDYKALIDAKKVRRIEIGVIPTLKVAGTTVALNAPSRTFDLARKAFNDTFYPQIVDATKCNKCHDALGTSFHSGDRGGNVTVCRLCHTTLQAGGHLETQSRSIDSYVHAIHNMQPFDIGDVEFADTVEAVRYKHHVESTYPLFTVFACESCHNPGTYNSPPSNADSLPGVHSATATLQGTTRTINGVPSYVQGPGARACGGCHRTRALNEDNAAAFDATNEHFRSNGYLLPATTGVLSGVIDTIMAIFN